MRPVTRMICRKTGGEGQPTEANEGEIVRVQQQEGILNVPVVLHCLYNPDSPPGVSGKGGQS